MGGFDLQSLMSKAKSQYDSLQKKMQETVVEATSGGGTVTAKMDGRKQLLSLRIDPEAVKAGDVEMLQDLVLAAINEAARKVDAQMQSTVGGMLGGLGIPGLSEVMRLAASGRTSVTIDPAFTRQLYPTVGYKICGTRAVRIDILERLADTIRPLIAWRPTTEQPDPPAGAINGYGFTTTVAMTSLLGCSGEDFAGVLRALGYRLERKPAPRAPQEPRPPAVHPVSPRPQPPRLSP